MTQPQPPHEPPPPRGEFGAPVDPPPGGHVPPVPPSYGPPQMPPGQMPPGQVPPGQVPPGYGPPGYGRHTGYGYPTRPLAPPRPGRPQQGRGGKKVSAPARIIIAAGITMALIIGAGFWYAASRETDNGSRRGPSGSAAGGAGGGPRSGGGEEVRAGQEKVPGDPRSAVAFRVPAPEVTDTATVEGSWVTGTTYVKTGINRIVGYDVSKGTQLWVIPLPGQLCAASRHVAEGHRTAVVFEPARRSATTRYQPCTEVAAIDLVAGRLLWSKSVRSSGSGDEKVSFDEVTLSGTTVAAGGTDGGAAFDLGNGAIRWKPEITADNCRDMGYGGGKGLVAARACGTSSDPQVSIQNLNPLTGAVLSSYNLPPGVEYPSIVSTVPLVVAADVGDTAGDGSGISDFFSVDEKTGTLRAKIAAPGDTYAARCASTEVEGCGQLAVGNGRIYLPTEEHVGTGGAAGRTNEIVSFDLATGKATADRADAGDGYAMYPLRMDGGDVLAYKWPPYDKGGQIVSIDGDTFEETVLMENPSDESVRDVETGFSLNYSEILFSGGRMFVSGVLIGKRSGSAAEEKSFLALAFSTD